MQRWRELKYFSFDVLLLRMLAVPSSTRSRFYRMPSNISLYCVPIAWLLALSPRGYSVLTFTRHSKNLQKIDSAHLRTPRTFKDIAASDASVPQLYRERIVRAESASLNGLENLGLFAAAVAVGNAAKLDVGVLNRLALGYVASRALYNVIFLNNDTNRFIFVRTAVFMVGTAINIMLFVLAGMAFNSEL